MRPVHALLPLTLVACDGGEPAPGTPGELPVHGAPVDMPAMAPPMEMVLANSQVVDLSQGLAAQAPVSSDGVSFEIVPTKQHDKDGVFVQTFTTGEQTGTHVDAPLYLVNDGTPVSDLPLEQLVGSAAVVDVVAAVAQDPGYSLTVADLEAWEARHGDLDQGDIVMVRTGWAARWNDPAQYRGEGGEGGVVQFPGVSVEASTYLSGKGVLGLGIDTLSCDGSANEDLAVHRQFLGAGGYCVENLARLEQLPEAGATVIVAPLAIVGGGAAPARVLAIVPTGGPAVGGPPPGGSTPGGPPAGGAPGTMPAGQGAAPGPSGAGAPPGPPSGAPTAPGG